jgi:hypothetical protein
MRDLETDGRLQVISAVALLRLSGLVDWDRGSVRFIGNDLNRFHRLWSDLDPVFGRLACWINFSAGAEFLAKGVCLLQEVDVRKPDCVPRNPAMELSSWVSKYFDDPEAVDKAKVTKFGDLGCFVSVKDKQNKGKYLYRLCERMGAKSKDKELLFVAYDFLRRTIRNRDAHAYRPNERDDNFELVSDLFVPAFNILISWLPERAAKVNMWLDGAAEFIDRLPNDSL